MLFCGQNRGSARCLALVFVVVGLLWMAGFSVVSAAGPGPQIDVDDDGVTVQPGDPFTYTIALSAPVTATSVVVTQSIPSDVQFQGCVFISPLTGACAPHQNHVVFQIGPSLLPGSVYALQTRFVASQNLAADLYSRVDVTALDELSQPLSPATASITTPVHVPRPQITLTLDDGRTTVQPNDKITYQITVRNTGDALAENLLATLKLPSSVDLITATGGVKADVGGVIRWPALALAPQGSAVLLASVRVRMPIDPAVVELSALAGATYNGAAEPLPSDNDVDGLVSAAVAGRVWHDKNGNGLVEAGEPGIEGVTLTASAPNAPTITASTGSDGGYQFIGLPLKPYRISVVPSTLPQGLLAVQESDRLIDGRVDVDVSGGVQTVSADFGMAMPASIRDSLAWADINSDGLRNPAEAGIEGITMTLIYAGMDGTLDTADDRRFADDTDAQGVYRFPALPPGRYRLSVDASSIPSGYELGVHPQGSADGTVILTLLADQSVFGLDFGFDVLDLSVYKTDRDIEITTSMLIPYEISYANASEVDASEVVLTEAVPADSQFVPDSSHPDWACDNGYGAGSLCRLALGALPAGGSGVAAFTVLVADAMPSLVNAITNTVQIDDVAAVAPDPTPHNNRFVLGTPVEAKPDVTIFQTDGGTRTEPGNRLIYAITYANQGNQAATDLSIVVSVPARTRYEAAGSSARWDCPDRSGPGTECRLLVGPLQAGVEAAVDFAVRVDAAMPVNVTTIDSEVTIYAGSQEQDYDGELTPVDAAPDLILDERDNSRAVQPGDTVWFTLNYSNAGNRDAIGVLIVETIPMHTRFFDAGSTPGWDCPDGVEAGNRCLFAVGALLATESGSVRFAVTVDDALPPSVEQIQNKAVIAGSGIEYDILNNQSSTSIDIEDPTVVDLASFTVMAQEDDSVLLAWTTSAERNSWGFLLYRSTDREWENSILLTPHLIDAIGDDTTGAAYSFVDDMAAEDVHYYYWLHELEYNGRTNVYGPVDDKVQGAGPFDPENAVFIPVISSNAVPGN